MGHFAAHFPVAGGINPWLPYPGDGPDQIRSNSSSPDMRPILIGGDICQFSGMLLARFFVIDHRKSAEVGSNWGDSAVNY